MDTIITEEERQRRLEAMKKWEEQYDGIGETERIDVKTPNGGDYSVASYYDEHNRPCAKKDARLVTIVEYKKNGEYVNATTAFLR